MYMAFSKINRDLKKPRRQRHHRHHHQTKDSMSRTIAVHVRYKSLHISCCPLHKQQREMTSSAHFGERERRRLIFRIFIWNLTLALHI